MRGRTLLLVALAAIVFLAGGVVFARKRSRSLERALQALEDERNETFAFGHLVPAPVPDAENAAPFYEEAFKLAVDVPGDADAGMGEPDAWAWPDSKGRISLLGYDEFLAANAAAFAKVEEGAARPRCRYEWGFGRVDSFGHPDVRAKVTLLCWNLEYKAFRDAQLGRGDLAAKDAQLSFRLQRALDGDECLVSLVVRLACRGISRRGVEWALRGEPGEAALLELRRAIDEAEPPDELARAIQGERALCLGKALELDRHPEEHGDFKASDVSAWDRPEDLRAVVEGIAWLTDLARKDELPASEALRSYSQRRHLLSKTLIPQIATAFAKRLDARARMAVASAAVSLRIHRLRHGAYPDVLDELVPEVLPRVPLDPFTGKPLHYTKTEAGFQLWSVGRNRTNDGGPGMRQPDGEFPEGYDDVGIEARR
jgi:hypothetical protein